MSAGWTDISLPRKPELFAGTVSLQAAQGGAGPVWAADNAFGLGVGNAPAVGAGVLLHTCRITGAPAGHLNRSRYVVAHH